MSPEFRDTQGSENDPAALQQRFLGSAVWTGGSRVLLVVFGLGVTATLARLLEPRDYGLLGMAMVFIGIVQQARDFGIGQALVSRKELDTAMISQAFTFALLMALGLASLCWVTAPVIGWLYNEPRVVPLIRTLAIIFPLTAFQVIPLALLRHQLKLRGEAVSRTVATILDAAVTVTFAWLGYGVWALVAGTLTNGLALALGLSLARPWLPRLRLRSGSGASLLRFGGGVTLSSFLWQIYSSADFFIIGRLLGSTALGTYTMAWNIAKMPWNQIWVSFSPMALPFLSRHREHGEGMSPALLRLSRGLSMLAFPALAGLAVTAEPFVTLFLGEKWLDAVTPLRWLCLYGLGRSSSVLLSPALLAAGRIRREVVFNAVCAVALPAAFVFSAQAEGLAGVAAVWALLYPLLVLIIMLPPALEAAGTPWGAYFAALARPAAATAGMSAVVAGLGSALTVAAPLLLATQVGAGIISYALFLRLLEGPRLFNRLRTIFTDMRQGIRP